MTKITRDNIDQLLDSRMIQAAMSHGSWWLVRRNGQTKTWKKDATRIRIPIKFGFKGTGAITESDFGTDGTLDVTQFRVVE